MKRTTNARASGLIFPLSLLILAPLSMGGIDETLGGIPRSGGGGTSAPGGGPGTGGANESRQSVSPGETRSGGGATVNNHADGQGKATLTVIHPGTQHPRVTVATKSYFRGEITGIEVDDRVVLGASCRNTKVVGTGGEIEMSGGSRVEVTNEGAAGGPNIVVELPSGSTIEVPPGSTSIINT